MATNVRNTRSGQKRGKKERRERISKGEFQDPSGINCLRKEIAYFDVDEEVIVIFLDRLELRLGAYLERPSARARDLAAAVTFAVALLLVFVTVEFSPRFGISASSWQVLCGVCLVGSFAWSGVCIISAIKAFRSRKTIKEFINELKEDCKAMVKNRECKYFDTDIEDNNAGPDRDEGIK